MQAFIAKVISLTCQKNLPVPKHKQTKGNAKASASSLDN